MSANTAKPKPAIGDDGLTQSERFMQAAQELECDDDPERFKERVRKVAKGATISNALSGKKFSKDSTSK